VVGCGRIGRLVAGFAAGLGARVVGHDAFSGQPLPGEGSRYADLATVLSTSDALTLHCPALPGGRPLLDAAALALVRPGAVLVNTARASLVDEAAVLAALEDGRLLGFATDVFPEEPPARLELVRHPRVIATPHLGGFTDESVALATGVAVDNLLEALGSAGRA
jgi:D-3-phosphoglycerate dehydrogenase